jgi:hypothetical protein
MLKREDRRHGIWPVVGAVGRQQPAISLDSGAFCAKSEKSEPRGMTKEEVGLPGEKVVKQALTPVTTFHRTVALFFVIRAKPRDLRFSFTPNKGPSYCAGGAALPLRLGGAS